ncbi:MAG: transglycosylase domain-containing protein, partial [Alphaproteobacteria bacterium]|nr:transglycosylase domain-containing protein [Alphaproteobacteria bacterium]
MPFLHHVTSAASRAWGRFRRTVHRGAQTRLRPAAERGTALLLTAASITANRFRRTTGRSVSDGLPRLGLHRLRAFALGILCTIAFVLVAGFGFLGYCAFTLPLSGGLAAQSSPPAIIIEDDAGRAFASRGNFRGEPVAFGQLPANMANAVLAVEDRRFFEHSGIDLSGILRAALRDLKSGTVREGGSTITQQLVRMTYLSPERTIKRKVQEAMLAIWLETRLSKQEILTRYLNTAYFGAGAYGVDAAAKRYFGKGAQSLDVAESAMLAGLIR